MHRKFSPLDRLIVVVDDALRISNGDAAVAARPSPAEGLPDIELDEPSRQHVAGLMRINHAGEVCAQALYAGQAATARSQDVRDEMEEAAREEIDHLVWCEQRLAELDSQPSLLGPLWYAGSFAIGAAAGLAGDGWSLGFVRETENQVEAHLQEHLGQLPADDQRSNAILQQMKEDEARHAQMAEQAGALALPGAIRQAMRVTAQVMKTVAYRI
jgi:ubiquinone biosynthesis monooxygenase Coq7